jgi:thiol-disulfide isomerase/thioredoxin
MTNSKQFMAKKKFIMTVFMLLLSIAAFTVHSSGLMLPVPGEPKAKNFTLMSANGGEISLQDYRGNFVLVNFWATWCPPCIKEMPALNSLHNKLKSKNFRVVGVHVGPALATVKQYLKDRPVDFDIVIDKNMSLSSWEVAGLPTTFLVNPAGEIIYRATGERVWDSNEMVGFLEKIMSGHERVAMIEPSADKF